MREIGETAGWFDILAATGARGERMKHLSTLAAAVLLTGTAFSQNMVLPKTPLKVGDLAPEFSVGANATSNRQAVKLSDFRGKKNVILAFFPAAFTGG